MSLSVTVKNESGNLKLSMRGRFDFNANKEFRSAYEKGLKSASHGSIELDLSGVDYMDSSALGMLLLLKERSGKGDGDIALTHCQDSVREILEVVNFSKIFSVN